MLASTRGLVLVTAITIGGCSAIADLAGLGIERVQIVAPSTIMVGDTVQAKAVAESKAKHRHDRLVIQQATERLPPVEEAMIRSVHAGGGAKADALVRTGERLCIDQSIELGDLRRPQDVLDHQIALKVEQVLLKLQLRGIHDSALPWPFTDRAATVVCQRFDCRRRD